MSKNLVLLDDDYVIRFVIKQILLHTFTSEQLHIYTSSDGIQGLGYIFITKPEIIIVDTTLPKYGGLEIIDYIKSNVELNNLGTKVIVILHNGDNINDLPDHYLLINKRDKNFLDNLVKEVNRVTGNNGVERPEGLKHKVMKYFGRKALKNADFSDEMAIRADRSKNILNQLLFKVRWAILQFITSAYLSMFYLFVGKKDKDINLQQSRKDLWNSRIRAYPGVAVILAAVFLFIFQILFIGGTFLGVIQIGKSTVFAAAYTWDGGGADNKWSTCANWTLDTCPTSADTVTFDGTSTKNSTVDVDFTGTVSSVTINTGYSGIIDLQRSLTVNTTFTQSGGTFTADSNALTVTTTFTLNSGATFNASSGTTTVSGSFTINGGTFNHNNGTVSFTGGSATLGCNNIIFNLVVITATTNTKTVNSNCNLPLGNNPTVGRFTLNGTFSGTGTLNLAGSGTFTFSTTGVVTGFTGFNSTAAVAVSGATLDFSSYSSFATSTTFTLNSGTLTLPNGADFNGAVNINGGTWNAPSGTMTIAAGLTVAGTPVFNHNNGTVTFDGSGSGTLSCNNITFNLVTFTHTGGTKTINSNCYLPLGNNPSIYGNTSVIVVLNGTLSGTGILDVAGFTFNAGAAFSGFTGFNSSGVSTVTISGGTFDLSTYSSVVINTQFTLSSGSVTLPNGSDFNSTLTISGGTFNAPSGTMSIASSFTVSGTPTFNTNGGTVVFDAAGGATLSCNNITFSNVVINNTGLKTVSSNCNLPLGNNPSIPQTLTLNGTLTGTGTITGSVGTLTINSTGVLSGFSGMNLNSANLTVAGATLDLSGYSTFTTGSGVVTLSSGSLSLPSGADLNNNLVISGGTFNAPNGNMTVAGALTISGSPTFNHNSGTITFDGATTATLSCNNVTFNLVQFTHTSGTKTINNNCNLPLGTNPNIVGGGSTTLNGTLSGTGKLTHNLITATHALTLNSGAVLSGFNDLEVDQFNISGATVDLSSYSGFTAFSTVTVSSGSLILPNGSDLNGALTISGGTFTAPSGTMNVGGNLTISGAPTFNHSSGTIVIDGTGVASLGCNSVTFSLIQFNNSNTKTVNSDCNLPLGTNPTLLGAGNVILNGTFTGTGTLTKSSAGLTLNTGSNLSGFNNLTLNTFTVDGATLDLNSYSSVTIGGVFTLSSGSVSGPTSAPITINSNYSQTGGTFTQGGTTTVNGTFTMDGSGAVFNGSSSALDINGDFMLNSGTFAAPSGNMTVAQNFSHTGGTFSHNNGTVVLDGGDQTIAGSTTFNNLVKEVTISRVITLPAGAIQTILGNTTLKGTSTQTLHLRASVTGIQWNIDPQGTRDIQYVNVQDGNNINATAIQLNGTGVNSGNNSNWVFGTPIVSNLGPSNHINKSYITDSTPTFNFTITDPDTNEQVKYKLQVDNNSDFSSPEINTTSEFANQGSFSFTPSSPLVDGNYYWRVAGIDPTEQPPVYTVANNSNIAFILDTRSPTGSIRIEDNPLESDPLRVNLIIGAIDNFTGVVQMKIADTPEFTGSIWESYTTAKGYLLPSGPGTKTVYIRFKDRAGNESIIYSNSITIVTTENEETITVTSDSTEGELENNEGNEDIKYTLVIRLVDDNNNPLRGVEVIIQDHIVITDENGLAVFESLVKGESQIIVKYADQEISHVLGIEGSKDEIVVKIVIEEKPNRELMTFLPIGLLLVVLVSIALYISYRKRKNS